MAATLDNENTMVAQIRAFAPLMMAYLECSDELQKAARKMFAALADPNLDEDDRHLAAMTLAEILFPNKHEGTLGSDLNECEQMDAKHSEETHRALEAMDDEEASFAERLRAVMDLKGVTQLELAEKIGVGQPAISMMLQRACRPQKRTVTKLAEALGVDAGDLWPNLEER